MEGAARRPWFAAGLAVLLVATLTDQGVEPLDASRAGFAAACLAAIALLVALRLGLLSLSRPALAVGAGVAVLAVALGGWRITDGFLADRYADGEFSWTRGIEDTRVGLVGSMRQYHLYGTDLSNHVQYLGRRGPHGAYFAIAGCAEWRRALNAGRYRYVVITPPNELFGSFRDRPARETAWTSEVPGAVEIVRQPSVRVFRLDRHLPEDCTGA